MTIKPDARNIRKHSDRNKKAIRQSLEAVGAGRSILIDADDNVLAGNGVFEQAQAMGLDVKVIESDAHTLIAVKRSDLSGSDARRAAALDNLVADTSSYDYDAALLKELAKDDPLVKAMADEDYRLRVLLGTEKTIDPNEEWEGMPEFEQEDKTAWKSVIVHFDSPLSMNQFAELVGQPLTEKTRSIWYPKAEIERYADKSYSDES